jgi:putative SOS response-associated peptidase YedK
MDNVRARFALAATPEELANHFIPQRLVPATGFYEWKHNGSRKQPYFVKMKNGGLFGMASIWESWQSPKGETVESCAIITTHANTIVAKLHDRMPVILPKDCYGLWLDSARQGFACCPDPFF